MKNIHLTIIGILLFLLSFYTGPVGIVSSLTGLAKPPQWFHFFYTALWIVSILGLKLILNKKHKFNKSDKFIYAYLILGSLNFVFRNLNQAFIINKPLLYVPAVIVMVLAPLVALAFYISILKAKKIWISLYSSLGIITSTFALIYQFSTLVLVKVQDPSAFANQHVIMQMAGGALSSYISMIKNWFLAGTLIFDRLPTKKKN